jgi:hypothetical protein
MCIDDALWTTVQVRRGWRPEAPPIVAARANYVADTLNQQHPSSSHQGTSTSYPFVYIRVNTAVCALLTHAPIAAAL